MTTPADGQVDLEWAAVKEQIHHLVSNLYQRIGFSEIGSSRSEFPIYDLGHPNRGFTTYPRVLVLSGLENCEFDTSDSEITRLKANIGAPTLLEQLHTAITAYLDSDNNLHP